MEEEHYEFTCEAPGDRLDRFLAGQADVGLSRSRIQALIDEGYVTINDAVCFDSSRKLKSGDVMALDVPPPVDDHPVPENIPLNIVYEDDALLVINKPVGLVVHAGAGHSQGTLVNALLHHCGDTLSGIGGVRRPGIVHRLDKDTSGLMIVAKSDRAHQGLASQLADRSLSRTYKALVWRVPQLLKGTVDAPVGRHPTHRIKMAVVGGDKGGREAITHFERVESFGNELALVDCHLETGRTHQIRVHMNHIGHPLVGDPLYGLQPTGAQSLARKLGLAGSAAEALLTFPRQALHAWHIRFVHPLNGTEMGFDAPLATDMSDLINTIKSNS